MIYISVGAAFAVLLLGAAIFIWCYRRRRKNEAYGFVKFYVLTAYKQEPMIRSEQLPCAFVTAFPRTTLFLERFWANVGYLLNFTEPVSKTYRPKNDIFGFLIHLVFLFDFLCFEWVHRYGGNSIFAGKSALKCVLK